MDRFERRAVYSQEYIRCLDRLKIAKYTASPETYAYMKQEAAEYREYAKLAGQIDDLPPVPDD